MEKIVKEGHQEMEKTKPRKRLYRDLYRVACRVRTLELENQQLKSKLKRVKDDKYVVLRRTDLEELVKKAKYQPPSISLREYEEK